MSVSSIVPEKSHGNKKCDKEEEKNDTCLGTCPLIHPHCFRSRSRYLFYRNITLTLTLSEKQFGWINGQVPIFGLFRIAVKWPRHGCMQLF